MLGSIDPKFMDVPPEVLVTAMRAHQKYFSLLDAEGRLAPRFVLVANTEAADGGKAIVAGNERVLRARLSDAKFFWDEDRKRTLESRVPKLAERVFHAKLGTQRPANADERTAASFGPRQSGASPCGLPIRTHARSAPRGSARRISRRRWSASSPNCRGSWAATTRCTTASRRVVADAIAEHYAPQGPSDRCPTAPVSVAVALADKLDTLVGFFAIGEKPTGSKDPFALRRAALGVMRIDHREQACG